MKALLLASTLLAAPLIAQTAPPADPAPPGTAPAPPAEMATPPAAASPVTPVFVQPPTVAQAFPPPPPKASYPWCSRTVTDGCKQRNDPK